MTPIVTDAAPAAIGPYAQAIAVDDWIFTSGQLPLTLSGEMPTGIEAKAEQVFDNLAAVLREAGTSLDQVVKATVFVTDLGDFTKLNAIYAKRFGAHKPARSTVQVAALPRGASIEIEVIARLPRAAKVPGRCARWPPPTRTSTGVSLGAAAARPGIIGHDPAMRSLDVVFRHRRKHAGRSCVIGGGPLP